MSESKKIGIIWAAPFSDNLGVSALSWSTASLVQGIAARRGWDLDLHFFCAGGNRKVELDLPGGKLKATTHEFLDLTKWKTYLKAIVRPKAGLLDLPRMDVVLDVGEGDSFSDIYGEIRFNRLVATKRFLTRLGRKQVLMPQTIGPFASPEVETRARTSMLGMTKLFARDRQSLECADRLVGSGKCSEIVDLAFLLPYTAQPKPSDGIHVGLNVSGLLWNGGYDGGNQFKLASNYPALIRRIAAGILARPGTKLHLLGHVLSDRHPVEDDLRVCQALAAELGSERVVVAPRFTDPCQAKSYISGMHFFAGARMHSCIGAFSAGVPVIPMAYSRKFNGLFQQTLGYPWLADMCAHSEEEVFTTILDAIDQRAEMEKAIALAQANVIAPRLEALSKAIEACLENR